MNREEALKILINGESEPCYKTCDEDCGKVMICLNHKCKWAEAMDVIRDAVKNRPSGHWETLEFKASPTLYKCSNCSERMLYQYNFCPNCGADMKEGEEE